MTEVPTPRADGVHLENFELLVYGRRRKEAVEELLLILWRLKRGEEFAGHACDDTTRPRLYSRLAAAISSLIADPQLQMDQKVFDKLAVEHSTLCAIFQSSVFESTDFLLHQFASPAENDTGQLSFTGSDPIAKLLLLYSLDSGMEIDLSGIFKSAPRMSLPAFLGRVGRPAPVSLAANARRNALLELGPMFEEVEIEEHLVDSIAEAYFYCSYADAPHKHQIKRTLNILLRHFIEKRGLLPPAPVARDKIDRPTMLVPLERFRAVHAMYRCFAPYVRQLRSNFRLVAIAPASELDDVSRQCFDDVIELPDEQVSFPDLLVLAQSVEPDLIYYPSIGMSPWAIAMSTVRLAPIQVVTLGHPATTHSPEIDYVVIPESMPGDERCFSETVLLFEGSISVVERFGAKFPSPSLRAHPDKIRVAVPAAQMKLNAPFMASCKAIAQNASRPVEFQFFPHYTAMGLYQLTKQIKRWIPEAVVHGAYNYDDYIRILSNCDVHLSTYPFGGANSNIDSMRLCIPIVTLEGPEVHSQTDSGMMRAVGMPEWLITHNSGEFESAALRLIDNDDERVGIANMLLAVNVENVFLKEPNSGLSDDFSRTFRFIYTRHAEIVRSARRYWSVAQRKNFLS